MLSALLLTILFESITAFILGIRKLYGQAVILFTNLITNPILNCILTLVSFYISPDAFYYFLIPLECAIVVAEGLIYRKTIDTKLNPFLFSLILNAASLILGTLTIKIIR